MSASLGSTCSDLTLSDDMVGTNEASSADRRWTLEEARTDDFLDGVLSEASSADKWSDAVLAGVSMVWSSAEKRSEGGSYIALEAEDSR